MITDPILRELESLGNPDHVAGTARYGLRTPKVFGVSLSAVRAMAKEIGKMSGRGLPTYRQSRPAPTEATQLASSALGP
jgi:hypothetical protein